MEYSPLMQDELLRKMGSLTLVRLALALTGVNRRFSFFICRLGAKRALPEEDPIEAPRPSSQAEKEQEDEAQHYGQCAAMLDGQVATTEVDHPVGDRHLTRGDKCG